MRVLIAHSFYRTFGGEDRYAEQQMKLLSSSHEVALLQRSNRDLPGSLRTGAQMIFSSEQKGSVERAIEEFEPDVIHVHNPYPGFGPAVHLAAARRGTPLVMTVHNFRLRCPNSLMFTEGSLCRRCERGVYAHALVHECFPTKGQALGYSTSLWVHRFILKLENKVDLFVAPSRFMQEQLEAWGISRDRIALVRNFTEVPRGSPSPGTYGLYFGRLSAEKGVDHLIAALKVAGDPRFRIVGDGPLEEEVRRSIKACGLTNTELTGLVAPEDIPELLRNARVVVLPSVSHENAPLAALEAMSAARPLIVTDRGGLPELVEGGAGVTCKANDAQDLGRAIGALMDDPSRCQEAGRRGLLRATQELGPRDHLARLEEVYRAVTGKDGRSRPPRGGDRGRSGR